MGLSFTGADLARFDAASRTLLSPLAAADPQAWMEASGRAVRDLVAGERVVLLVPGQPGRYRSEDAPEVASGVLGYIEGASEDGIAFSDPVVRAWYLLRREGQHDVMSWDDSRRLVEAHGHRMLDSPIVADVLLGRRFTDFAAMTRATPEGDAMIWTLHRRHGGFAFGEETAAALRLLLPAFRAGLDALGRLRGQRAALDAVAEPLAVFDADGRALHRNAALSRLLEADPERFRLEAELLLLSGSLRSLAFPRHGCPSDPPGGAERRATTGAGTYTLRGALLPPGAFSDDGAVLVTVHLAAAPRLPEPEALRPRFGLTKREAEVALLLAAGLRNDAVAERLFVSPHTARHHVENVMAKLEVSSRAAVAARLLAA